MEIWGGGGGKGKKLPLSLPILNQSCNKVRKIRPRGEGTCVGLGSAGCNGIIGLTRMSDVKVT